MSDEDITKLDDYARALATMETLINQIQLLPYRNMSTMMHNALKNVINPTNYNTIPDQDRQLQPALQISQVSIHQKYQKNPTNFALQYTSNNDATSNP